MTLKIALTITRTIAYNIIEQSLKKVVQDGKSGW